MYYDDEDDDPYAPRIGPVAMPSPRSRFAPYYSGHANTFEDFLEEFEGRAYDCALTDPQRVDVIIRYVAPSLRDFWRSLNGYCSRDWPLFRQSLITVFGSTTPRPQVMRQRLLSYIQDSARKRMYCEDDVLRYYRQFICFGLPLVHAGHLSEEERDTAFWYGFHPDDREVLRPRLLGKNPLQPPDVPFHFEDVFGCARAAFAYDDYFPSPWSHAKQFEPPSLRREQPVVEPAPRNTYGLRAMTRAIASNAEITTTPDELSLSSHSTPFTQLPPSSSPSVLESQHGLVHSVTLDQPEPTYTLSTTLPPSDSPLSYTPTLVYSATDNDPIFASTPPSSSVSSTLLPSASPSHTSSHVHPATDNDLIPAYTFPITTSTLSTTLRPSASFPTSFRTHSLAPSAAADAHEIPSTSSPTLAPFSMPISSDFEYLPSATVHQPAPTWLSTFPSSSISSTFLPSPARLAMEDQLEPEPSIDDVFECAATPPPSSSTSSIFLPSPVRLEMNNQPESEHEAASTSMSVPLLSLPLSTLHPSSPTSSTFLPFPVTSATDCQPKSEPASESPVLKLDLPPCVLSPPPDLMLVLPISSPTLSSLPRPEISTLDSMFAALSPDRSSSLPGSLSQLSRPCELESSVLVSAADVVTLSHPELPLSSQGESIPFPPASLEAPPNATVSPHSTSPQRPPGLKTIDSVSSPLDITPAFVLSTPRLGLQAPLIYEAPSTLAPRLSHPSPPLLLSRSSLARFGFALVFITTAALVSTLFNASTTVPTFARKFWSKYEDFGGSQNGTFKTSNSCNVFAQRLRLGQLTPRAPRLVFDPGGSVIAPDLGTRRRSQTQVEDIISSPSPRSTPASFIPVSTLDDLIVFDSGGGAFC